MARTGKKRSNMPAMVTRLFEPTIYHYDPIRLHTNPPRTAAGPPRTLSAGHQPLDERPEPCWIGACPGCGKWLNSATDNVQLSPDAYYCTRACRAAHA